MATLQYHGFDRTTFHDVTVYARDEDGNLVQPLRSVTARVGEVIPEQVFTVPDECVEPFLRRSDISLIEDKNDSIEDAKPRRKAKTNPGDEDLAGEPAAGGTTQ